VPKKFFRRRLLFGRPPPPPTRRRQKNFGQCTILGVQKFFGHTKIFRNIQIFPILGNFPKNWQNLSHFFYSKLILPDCRANIARLALFAQQTGGAGAPPAPAGTPMVKTDLSYLCFYKKKPETHIFLACLNTYDLGSNSRSNSC
jgi:hypothetical protein